MSIAQSSNLSLKEKLLDCNHNEYIHKVYCKKWSLYKNVVRWSSENRFEYMVDGSTIYFKHGVDALAATLKWM